MNYTYIVTLELSKNIGVAHGGYIFQDTRYFVTNRIQPKLCFGYYYLLKYYIIRRKTTAVAVRKTSFAGNVRTLLIEQASQLTYCSYLHPCVTKTTGVI